MTRYGTLATATAVAVALLGPAVPALYWTALACAIVGVALVLVAIYDDAVRARRRRAARARTRARLDAHRARLAREEAAEDLRRRDTWEQPAVFIPAQRLEPELFGWAADPRDPDALESRHAAARTAARHALRA